MSRAVIDQPGLKIFSFGLVIALVFGFTLKKQISPERLQSLLQKSIERLEKDFFIDYETVEVKLSNWGVPWPRIEMSRIRLSPKKNSCQDSQIYIDKIEAPISFFALINSRSVIDTLRIQNVELRVADIENCFNTESKKAIETPATAVKESSIGADKKDETIVEEVSFFRKPTSAQLKNIYIDKLKVVTKSRSEQPVLFRQLHIAINYATQKISEINIKSQILALNEPKNDLFYFAGDLNAALKPNEQNDIDGQLNLKGRMLDGPLQAFIQYNSASKKVVYEVEANKISIRALLPYASLGEYEAIFDKWPLSLSFKLIGDSLVASDVQTNFKIKNMKISGEQTNVSLSDITIKNKENDPHIYQFEPFEVNISELPLTSLKNVNRYKTYLKSFDSLGHLNAYLKFNTATDWKLSGYLKNTEIIFSNRGSREIQKVDAIQMAMNRKSELAFFKFDQIKLNGMNIDGSLDSTYNFEKQKINAKMNLSGQVLSEKVWRQLTQIEQNPVVKINWNYNKESNDEKQKLFMLIPNVDFPGLNFKGVNISFNQDNKVDSVNGSELSLVLKTSEVSVSPEKSSIKPLNTLFSELTGLTESQYKSNNLMVALKGESWKNMSFVFDTNLSSIKKSKIRFKGIGSWKDESIVSSDIQMQNDMQIYKFDIAKDNSNNLILRPIVR